MENKSTVAIELEEYKQFIISQYENRKIKAEIIDEIKELEKQKNELQTALEKRKLILELAFRRDSMTTDSREEQKQIKENHIGNYAGYSKSNVKNLLSLGFKIQDLINYVDEQWDEREKSQEVEEKEVE